MHSLASTFPPPRVIAQCVRRAVGSAHSTRDWGAHPLLIRQTAFRVASSVVVACVRGSFGYQHWQTALRYVAALLAAAAILLCFGCENEVREQPVEPLRLSSRVILEDVARDTDAEIQDFVMAAMTACVAGDYASLRRVWSAADVPIEQHQFERRWQPVERIVIQRLGQATATVGEGDSGHHYMAARFELGEGAPKRERDLLLLIVRENDAWRLARPPRGFADRIRLGDDTEADS